MTPQDLALIAALSAGGGFALFVLVTLTIDAARKVRAAERARKDEG